METISHSLKSLPNMTVESWVTGLPFKNRIVSTLVDVFLSVLVYASNQLKTNYRKIKRKNNHDTFLHFITTKYQMVYRYMKYTNKKTSNQKYMYITDEFVSETLTLHLKEHAKNTSFPPRKTPKAWIIMTCKHWVSSQFQNDYVSGYWHTIIATHLVRWG